MFNFLVYKADTDSIHDSKPILNNQSEIFGVLTVSIIEAKNLRSVDAGGTSDPYGNVVSWYY